MQLNSRLPIIVTVVALTLLVGSSIIVDRLPFTFVKNYSASERSGLYLVRKSSSFKRGDLVLITFPEIARSLSRERAWLHEDIPLLKRIAAVEADRICHRQGKLTINGIETAAILNKDHEGRGIQGITGCYTIKPGYFLPINTYSPYSFDGRYFGAIPRELVLGKASPLLTF